MRTTNTIPFPINEDENESVEMMIQESLDGNEFENEIYAREEGL